MARVQENKRIQRKRTADEMRMALNALVAGVAQHSIPPQIDDSDVVLTDAIEDLLDCRATLEEMRGFVNQWQVKLTRR